MGFQKTVLIVVWGKHQVGGAFDNWIVRGVQLNCRICEVAAPKLGATHSYFAILTISEEYRSLDWPYEELGVFASVNGDLCSVIEKNDSAVFEIFDHEIDAIDVTGHFDEQLVSLGFEHEVSFVKFFLFCYHWSNFWS